VQDFFYNKFKDKILVKEPMKNHTSFKIGGKADILFFPDSINDIIEAINFCDENNIKYFIMGNGTNLLVSDDGFRGVIIKINKNFTFACNKKIKLDKSKNEIEADSGVLLGQLSKFALKNNLAGLEFASGIPGTLGGAICMNAGAYGKEIKDVFVSAKILYKNQIKIYNDLKFSYRKSLITNSHIILSARIKLLNSDKNKILEKINEYSKKRRDTQPLNFPNAGSIFKRPENNFAGKLIMDAGLADYKIGDACVSRKHCGFIINLGNATAQNVYDLIYYIIQTVKNKFNILLEPEIKFIGEFNINKLA